VANTPKRLVEGSALTAAAATYYTTPANARAIIRRMVLYNPTASPVACSVYLVASGGSAAATNLVKAPTLAAGESMTITEAEGQVLEAGGTIQALGLGVTLVASGVEVT
jgi:hypothetical protein